MLLVNVLMAVGLGMTYLSCFWIAVHALSDSETFRKSPESSSEWTIILSMISSLGLVLLLSFVMGSKFLVAIAI